MALIPMSSGLTAIFRQAKVQSPGRGVDGQSFV